jgi:hypothetical protein
MSATTGQPNTLGQSGPRLRWLSIPVRLFVTMAAMLVGLVGTATMASAWHAVVSAQSDCRGAVTYHTSAWDNASANPQIQIAYSANGTAGPWTVVTVGAFNKADNFAFGGTFTPTPNAPGTTVTVRAKATAPWVGQTTVEANPQYAVALIPDRCQVPLSVKLSCPSSVVFGRATTFTAAPQGGVAPYSYRWTLNGNGAGTDSPTVTLTLNSSRDVVFVTVTDQAEGRATATASCQGSRPAPTVTMSCPAGFGYGQAATWTAHATAAVAGDTLSFRWTLNDTLVGTDSPSVTTTLNSANDKLVVKVTETSADESTASATVTASCEGTHDAPKVSMSCPAGFVYGQPATWTVHATPAVAGDTLSYRWTLDGALVGTNSPSVTVTLRSAKDILTVTVTETFVDGRTSVSSASQSCTPQAVVLIPPLEIVNTPVPAAIITPQATLPFTGRNLAAQLALAAGLLGAGVILLGLSGSRISLGRLGSRHG